MVSQPVCDQCTLPEPDPWFEQPMNESIKQYARSYTSPVKMFYKDLDEAMKVWGTEINDEDI